MVYVWSTRSVTCASVRCLQGHLRAGRTPGHEIQVIGTRHGEKLYEVLLSREEMACAEDRGDYFRVPPDLRDLNYAKFVEEGETRISQAEDYNSHNTTSPDLRGDEGAAAEARFHSGVPGRTHTGSGGLIVRVVVTGADGFIGRNLVVALAPRNDVEVVSVTRATSVRNWRGGRRCGRRGPLGGHQPSTR